MIVDMRGIFKNYYRDKNVVPVLKNIDLQIEKGDYVAIMGPSGSGKTTLMNLLGFLDRPTEGSYKFEGVEYSMDDDDKLAEVRNSYIGFVFQSFYLLPKLTALDNVALPLLYSGVSVKERRERAAKALADVGLSDRAEFYPNQLSGGQCQRVAIARAMVTNPSLLLADEPTGALDTASGAQIMEIFSSLNSQGVTIVVITHELAVADCAEKTFHLLDGEIVDGLSQNDQLLEYTVSKKSRFGLAEDSDAQVDQSASENNVEESIDEEPAGQLPASSEEASPEESFEASIDDEFGSAGSVGTEV